MTTYTTLNPSDATHALVTGGNLTATQDGTGYYGGVRAMDGQHTGKFYFEWAINSLSIGSGGGTTGVGVSICSFGFVSDPNVAYGAAGNAYLGSGKWHMSVIANGATPVFDVAGFDTTVQPFGIAVDVGNQLFWVYCPSDGYWNGSATANPATGTGGISLAFLGATLIVPTIVLNGSSRDSITVNFGASAFANPVPSGFTAGWPAGAGTCANPNPPSPPTPPSPPASIYWVEVLSPFFEQEDTLFDAWFLDGAIVPSSAITVTVNGVVYTRFFGLYYQAGNTVTAWIGGLDCGDYVVQADGHIDVPYAPANTYAPLYTAAYLAGLVAAGWDGATNLVELDGTTPICAVVGNTYTSTGQTLRPALAQEAGAQNGPAQGKTRRTHWFTALLQGTQGLSIGVDGTNFFPVKLEKFRGGPSLPVTQLFNGVVMQSVDDSNTLDSMLTWTVTRPYPVTVVNIGGFLATQDQ